MTWVVMAFLLIGGSVLQVRLPPVAVLGQAKFPFLLGVVVYYSLNREPPVMLIAALVAGFLQDALSPIPLGYSVSIFCITGWIVSRFRKLVMFESIVTHLFFGATTGILSSLVVYLLLLRDGSVVCHAVWAAWKAVGTGILGMLCAPVMCMAGGALDRVVGNVAIKEEVNALS